jgi:hypothetical protein
MYQEHMEYGAYVMLARLIPIYASIMKFFVAISWRKIEGEIVLHD